jgi:hypothetical protein
MASKVRRLGKRRFLQNEARLWVIGNKALELMVFGGVISAGLLYYFYPNESYILVGVMVMVALFSALSLYEREKMHEGYREGYEAGYTDGYDKVKMKQLSAEETREALDKGIENARGYIFNRTTIYDKSRWE